MDLPAALRHLEKKLGSDPLVPDADGRVSLAFAGGLVLLLIPAARGRLVAEIALGRLPAAQGAREERLQLVLARALAMMKAAEEVVALDESGDGLLVWRELDLPALQPAGLEEAVARLLDRAEWLMGEPAPMLSRPVGPLLFFP